MTPRQMLASALLIAALLVSVSLVVGPLASVFSGGVKPQAVSWPFTNADANSTDYVRQTQIGAQNVGSLSLAWSFPFPSSQTVPGLAVTGSGVISPPLVVNGTVYVVTNFLAVYAMNAATGVVLWTWQDVLNTTGEPLGPLTGHVHGINYYKGDVWVSMPDCSAYGLNATTGDVQVQVTDICANIPGNDGLYAGAQVPPTFYEDTMFWEVSVPQGTDVGRGFMAAYNINFTSGASSPLWRWFVAPPAGGDPNWDVDSCSINSTSNCHGNVTPVSGDWGSMGYLKNVTGAGAGPTFGDPTVDSSLGIVYVSTSQPSPTFNGTFRPGPDLYSDSVVALNVTDGKMLWFYQTTPHDLFDFDCGWNTALGSVTQNGKVVPTVFKACKNGYVYALDAVNGSLLWYFDPPSLARSNTANANYVVTGKYSANQAWGDSPSPTQFTQCPGEEGGVESDIAFAYGMVYVATHNYCTYVKADGVQSAGVNDWGDAYATPDNNANTTIYAISASSNKTVWSYSIPSVPFRGWLTVSNGLVFGGSIDGSIYALDAHTGRLVSTQYLGTSLYDSPTFGSTSSGQVLLFQLTGSAAYGPFDQPVPGSLMAFAPSLAPAVSLVELAQLGSVLVLVAAALVVTVGRRGNSYWARP